MKPKAEKAEKPARRVRRPAAEARERILDAAERRLQTAGPAGIRLQEIAADVGIAHPTILHHFGSREGLVEAVVLRALEGIQREVIASVAQAVHAPDGLELIRRIMTTLGDRGHARLLAWLALEGRPQDDPSQMLRALAEVMHTRRLAETGLEAPFEDTLFVVVLTSFALVGEGILGTATWDSAGLGNDRAAPSRFQRWLAELLEDRLHRLPAPTPAPAAKAPRRKATRG